MTHATNAALSREETETLGRYNAEAYRGVMHTPEWKRKMADLQARFDRKDTTSSCD